MPDNCNTVDIFPEQPDIRPTNVRTYILNRSYIYEDEENYIHIPKNFELDGASVPRIFWTLTGITPDGIIRAASCVHDWLYVHRGEMQTKTYTRKECDKLFKKICLKSGLSKFKAELVYNAVRIGGAGYWNSDD